MSKLYEKLNKEADHIRLTHAEKNAMREAIFGAAVPTPSAVRVTRSPYVFLSSNWMRALAALVLVVFAGGGTAFASEGALPGQPLYAIKTNVIEPMQVALAPTPAAKAAVHVEIAQARVAEAEALAERGNLDATTSAQLAANFEEHAHSAVALADQASSTDPGTSAAVKAQLAVNTSVGSAVLVALADDGKDRDHADAFVARVLAVAGNGRNESHGDGEGAPMAAANTKVAAFAPAAKSAAPMATSAEVRTFAAATTNDATNTDNGEGAAATNVVVTSMQQKVAASLQLKAQDAIANLRDQFAAASSTLDASTTVSVQTQLSGIDSLMQDGAVALNDSVFDTAVKDFTQAYGRALRLSALLKAQQTFSSHAIDPLFNNDGTSDGRSAHGDSAGGSGGGDQSTSGDVVHGVLEQL